MAAAIIGLNSPVRGVGIDTAVLAAAALVVLGGLWTRASGRHRQRRRHGDWQAGLRPQAWTSVARCPACDGVGGVLTEADERTAVTPRADRRHHPQPRLRFACLSCGHEHDRRAPG